MKYQIIEILRKNKKINIINNQDIGKIIFQGLLLNDQYPINRLGVSHHHIPLGEKKILEILSTFTPKTVEKVLEKIKVHINFYKLLYREEERLDRNITDKDISILASESRSDFLIWIL